MPISMITSPSLPQTPKPWPHPLTVSFSHIDISINYRSQPTASQWSLIKSGRCTKNLILLQQQTCHIQSVAHKRRQFSSIILWTDNSSKNYLLLTVSHQLNNNNLQRCSFTLTLRGEKGVKTEEPTTSYHIACVFQLETCNWQRKSNEQTKLRPQCLKSTRSATGSELRHKDACFMDTHNQEIRD